ncbi:MAG TPA: UDP-N-acetylglucosamine 1-carboxyvinyltransferase [Deltaproteobacteria bacterium]|nr:UDP-N-acetylglucosamine 1-carboxyvinyltransferase [Deltaproteobacteria bacterium]
MDKLVIEGGRRLIGEVEVSGSKNSALPIMAATLLAAGTHRLGNVPELKDIETFSALLTSLGCTVERSGDGFVIVNSTRIDEPVAGYELVKTMRASILVLGPLVARCGRARVSLPGGCAIGARPVNLHLKGLELMGADVRIEHGYIDVRAKRLKGAHIYLDYPTVTGTENIMLAATLAEGETLIENAALEPEVVELARALKKMGAGIEGEGTDKIKIKGVEGLNPLEYTVMPDRIEAGTLMVGAAMTRGNVLIKNCPYEYMDAVVTKLKEAGTEIKSEDGGIRVVGTYPIRSVDIKTYPYPGFPTDMQAQMMAMMCMSTGLSVITETVFENRFMHVAELKRMGADIMVDGRYAIVKGKERLSGAPVMATDLRASASLVLAGLVADGITEVSRIYHLDRGYERLEEKLKRLGAEIKRVKE